MFFWSHHQVGLACSQDKNHCLKQPPDSTAGESEDSRSENDEPKTLGMESQRPDVKFKERFNQGPREKEKE